MTDHTPFPAQSDPTPSRGTPPLPALGVVLAVCWMIISATWISVSSLRVVVGSQAQQLQLPTNALGCVLVVAVPLVLRQIPIRLQRRAMPFLVLAGVMALGAGLVGGSRVAVVLLVNASVLYVMGWLMLRGHTPKLMFVALGTPVLYGLGVAASLMLARQPGRRVLGYSPFGASTAWMLVEALLVGVLPVCIPVLVASLLRRRYPSDPAVEDAPVDGSETPPATGLNSFAIAALILGLTGGSVLAVIFGHVARSQIRRTKEAGGGLATAGLVLGYVGVVAAVVITLMGNVLVGILFLKVVG